MKQSNEYWNSRYKGETRETANSGYGSYGPQLERKVDWFSGLEVKSIVEYGCGDFHFGERLVEKFRASYIGYDTSDVVVELDKSLFPSHRFVLLTEIPDKLPEGDLLLCMDVLFHVLEDDEYEKVLDLLEKSWTKYLAITAYERDDDTTGKHVKIRKFDPKRFGTPILRRIVEESGDKYMYIFEKKPMIPEFTSCCLITKEAIYPKEILPTIMNFGFGEIMILTNCDSPHRKQELFQKAKFDYIYYQDDDAICPIAPLFMQAKPDIINCAMKTFHIEKYKESRIALLGWGALFPKKMIDKLDLYRAKFGEDSLYKRETERIMTYLNYPQNRIDLPIYDLQSAFAPDRLSNQAGHYDMIPLVEKRCSELI